jgi:hypothetical protein
MRIYGFGGAPPAADLSGYLTSATAASTYLTQANAASTYLTQANATSTYLTQASATSTYLAKAGGTMSGAIAMGNQNITGANEITSKYVKIDAAASPGMTFYVGGVAKYTAFFNAALLTFTAEASGLGLEFNGSRTAGDATPDVLFRSQVTKSGSATVAEFRNNTVSIAKFLADGIFHWLKVGEPLDAQFTTNQHAMLYIDEGTGVVSLKYKTSAGALVKGALGTLS